MFVKPSKECGREQVRADMVEWRMAVALKRRYGQKGPEVPSDADRGTGKS